MIVGVCVCVCVEDWTLGRHFGDEGIHSQPLLLSPTSSSSSSSCMAMWSGGGQVQVWLWERACFTLAADMSTRIFCTVRCGERWRNRAQCYITSMLLSPETK